MINRVYGLPVLAVMVNSMLSVRC